MNVFKETLTYKSVVCVYVYVSYIYNSIKKITVMQIT